MNTIYNLIFNYFNSSFDSINLENFLIILDFIGPEFSTDSTNIILLCSSMVPIKIYSNADTMKQDILKDNFKKVGVYRWINNDNNKTYVGSSINLSNRFRLYFNNDFISDKTRSKSLIHDALTLYGYSKFTLEILEYCDKSSVLSREQHYLDTLNPEYNLLKIAGNSTGFKHSEESILKRVTAFTENKKARKALNLLKLKENIKEYKISINFPLQGSKRSLETIELMRKNHSRSKTVYEYKSDK
ncbi:hypothetical protein EMPS_mp03 (mitochondrion) [Entomortierella parvispora]|uniref:GIY-YIG domain-containing protein n=1 Tax=Entomortierella parvispora TaxID=205924 RepID=A0A8J9T1U2_9FUNG|nr:hypothetical protein EMPS_mp03 [Entomortierella parvispora]